MSLNLCLKIQTFIISEISNEDDASVIEMVQNSLQPQIERRLAAKKRLDNMAVSTLLENITRLEKSNQPSTSKN